MEIIPWFGGQLERVQVAHGNVPLTFIPPFPIYPPEFAWMRQEESGEAGLVLNTTRERLPCQLRVALVVVPPYAILLCCCIDLFAFAQKAELL